MQRITPHLWYWTPEAEQGKIEEAQNWPLCYVRTAPLAPRGPEYVLLQGLDGLLHEIQVDGLKIRLPRSTFSGYTGGTHDIGRHVRCVSFDIPHHIDGNGVHVGLEIVDRGAGRRSQR